MNTLFLAEESRRGGLCRCVPPWYSVVFAIFIAMTWSNSSFATRRWIYDCGDPFGDTACYLDFLQGGYFYGRSEGEPPRGPNPLHATLSNGDDLFGSTDVDTLYDLAGQVQQYYTTVLNR